MRGAFVLIIPQPASRVRCYSYRRTLPGTRRLQRQAPSADTSTVMTSNTLTLPTRTLYAPNPPQLDDPWMRALLVLLIVFGLAALLALGS